MSDVIKETMLGGALEALRFGAKVIGLAVLGFLSVSSVVGVFVVASYITERIP